MTQGVKLDPPSQRSAGQTHRLESSARPETAEAFEIPPPTTKWPTEGFYVTLEIPRVEWCMCWVTGRPELAGVEAAAAAGARVWPERGYGALGGWRRGYADSWGS